jgi:hypothetical protein
MVRRDSKAEAGCSSKTRKGARRQLRGTRRPRRCSDEGGLSSKRHRHAIIFGLTLNISETDNSLDLDLVRSVAPFFGRRPRTRSSRASRAVVRQWRKIARRLGLSARACDQLARRFVSRAESIVPTDVRDSQPSLLNELSPVEALRRQEGISSNATVRLRSGRTPAARSTPSGADTS